ncbi:cytokine receptor family member b1 isoform X2 [Corythoichthys intestinalis]|nr:cytokine receptor family member b1 isoform X2 [Corythoichthys intestinalis]
MNWPSSHLNLIFLLDSVLGVLLPPANLSVKSVNFLHIVHWDPGPDTPPGVQYKIFQRLSGESVTQSRNDYITTATSLQLKLDKYNKYHLRVRAFYNGTWSPDSQEVHFTPFQQTIIGPPKVILTECDNCIQINISLPKAENGSGIKNNDILAFYKATKFRVLWKQDNKIKDYRTENKSFTVYNLEKGKEYCVKIEIEITINKNTVPSTWKCIITSTTNFNSVPVLLSGAAFLLIFIIGALMTLTYFLYYTGFIGKLQVFLPTALIVAPIAAKSLPIGKTSPDSISIGSDTHKRKKHTVTSALCAAHRTGVEEVDEEDQNEESHGYINKYGEISSKEKSCHQNCEIEETCLTVRSHTEDDASHSSTENDPATLDQLEAGDTFLSSRPEMEFKEQFIFELAEEMNVSTVSMSVDLSTVTLPAIDICEKERNTKDLLAELLRTSDQEPVMLPSLPVTKPILSQSDTDDLASMMCDECESEDDQTQETVEEELFSDYMGHWHG